MVGILLSNLGTPDNPEPEAVGRYLNEFLMDPLVVDIPAVFRFLLVRGWIVPRRKYASSALYKKIWSDRGSPLLWHTLDLRDGLRAHLGADFRVEVGMRYGRPSIEEAMSALRAQSVDRVLVVPLYPQFSLAATASTEKEARRVAGAMPISFVPPFWSDSGFLDAFANVAASYVRKRAYDYFLFSFHGLPERQVKKTDPSGAHCLSHEDCCDRAVAQNKDCYRFQCYETARGMAERLHINPLRYSVCFQSRLGRTPWIRPFTDEFYATLPQRGIRRILVFCPSFVADCLETLEEVQIRGNEQFIRSGGTELTLVPSLNSTPSWVEALGNLIRRQLSGSSVGASSSERAGEERPTIDPN